ASASWPTKLSAARASASTSSGSSAVVASSCGELGVSYGLSSRPAQPSSRRRGVLVTKLPRRRWGAAAWSAAGLDDDAAGIAAPLTESRMAREYRQVVPTPFYRPFSGGRTVAATLPPRRRPTRVGRVTGSGRSRRGFIHEINYDDVGRQVRASRRESAGSSNGYRIARRLIGRAAGGGLWRFRRVG